MSVLRDVAPDATGLAMAAELLDHNELVLAADALADAADDLDMSGVVDEPGFRQTANGQRSH
jgi:hypothetical protein